MPLAHMKAADSNVIQPRVDLTIDKNNLKKSADRLHLHKSLLQRTLCVEYVKKVWTFGFKPGPGLIFEYQTFFKYLMCLPISFFKFQVYL